MSVRDHGMIGANVSAEIIFRSASDSLETAVRFEAFYFTTHETLKSLVRTGRLDRNPFSYRHRLECWFKPDQHTALSIPASCWTPLSDDKV